MRRRADGLTSFELMQQPADAGDGGGGPCLSAAARADKGPLAATSPPPPVIPPAVLAEPVQYPAAPAVPLTLNRKRTRRPRRAAPHSPQLASWLICVYVAADSDRT